MSSAEKLCFNCLAVSKVPKQCSKEEIKRLIKDNFSDGQLLDAEEIPGIEAEESLTRWVVLTDSPEDVQKLIHQGQLEFIHEGSSYEIIFQKAIPCEIPERWEKEPKSPHSNRPVPRKRSNPPPTGMLQHQLPQNVAQYGMVSGFYENVHNRDPAPDGNVNPGHQYSQPPSQPTDPHDDQGLSSQQQFNQGGYNNPQAPPYPHPVHGYPPNFDPNQQNVQGDQGQGNMPQGHQGYPQGQDYPQGHQGYPQGHPQGQDYPQGHPQGQGYPQGPPGFQPGQPFFPGNQNYPGQMMYTDPNTGMRFMVPISGYPNQYNQTGPDGRPNVPPGQPRGPPPPYFEQKFGFASENTSEKEASLNTKNENVVFNEAINDQKLTEAKISSQGTDGQKSDEESDKEPEKSDEEPAELSAKLLVTNLPSTAHDEFIELFFASKKRFGGLEVVNVDYDEENASAIVEFESPEDVDAVLEKVPIKMMNQIVEVSRYEPEPEEPINPCAVEVSGPEDVLKDLETLEMYFENLRKSGGGDIDNIRYDDDLNLVIVTFEKEEDAQRVIERPQHTVRKQTLNVEQYIPRKKSIFHRENSVSDEEPFEDAEEVIKDTIKVFGVTASNRSTVELYFENKKRSGGGDIVEIWDNEEEEDVIYVKFEDVEVAERVLERENHVVKKNQLIVEQFIPVKETTLKPKIDEEKVVEDDEEEPVLDTVKISGVDPAKRSTIELYLENARRSGGGEYDKIWSDDEEEGVIYIKYKSEEVAKEVASRSHTVQGSELKASLYTPPKPPPCYDNKIIIKGLNETTSQDGLFNFIEAKSGFIPESMDYHETETDVVMVTFSDKPDFDKLEQIFQKFKLEGNTLKIAPVPLSDCIMVSDLPENITQDTVQFYFENKRRCGGGDVQKVTMNDDDTCLVYFVDYTVIDNVLERQHTLSKQTVTVQRYQECLGRPEGDVKERKLKIPEPIIMKELDQNKVKYLKNSEKNKSELEKLLKDCHSDVCWPGVTEDVVIKCTITQSVDGCYRLVKTWNNDVMEVVENYMGNIVAEKFDVLQDAWEKVMKKLQEINIANPECLALFIDKKTSLITIVGIKAAVVELKKKIEDILKDVMDEMERERQKVKEVVDNLKVIETKMLLANKFPEKMQSSLGIQVKINATKNEIVFEGPSGSVRDAKLAMHEAKNTFVFKKLENIPKLSAQLYLLKQTKEYIVKQLKAKHVTSVWEVERNMLTVCSSEDHIDDSFDIVKKSVTHSSITLKKGQAMLVTSEKWSSKTLELQSSNQGKCVIQASDDNNKILVSCTDDIHQEIEDSIRKFFRLNAILSDKVSCTKNAHRLISKHHNGEVEKIAKNLEEYNVQIISSDKYGGFEVKGTEDGIKKAKKKLEELLNRVKKEEHSVDKPGFRGFMSTPKGKDMLNTVEQSYEVVVSQGEEEDDDDNEAGRGIGMGGIQIFAKSDLYGCREVICGKGDMTEMDVEVLVNSANEKLAFSGGLGKVILKKGGKSIETECRDYLKTANRLADGEIFVSGAGKLKASYIIHIRGPVWNGGSNNEEEMLEEAVFKCLVTASSKGATSVAMPAISCGAYGFPVQRAAETIVGAVKNYFREEQDSNVETVYLCDVKSETVAAFSAAMVKEIGHSVKVMQKKAPEPAKRTPWKGHLSRHADSDDDSSKYRARKKPPGAVHVLPSRSGGSDDSITINNVTVTVIKAEIAKEKVDMIVNTTAKNLDLKNGAVSASLLKAGGDGLQDEINKSYPNGIKDGEIATTSGHKLKCQYVVHTSLTNYDSKNPGKSKAALRKLMINCLNEAENQGVSSIAFPAIGTGNLGYPKDVVASEMFTSVSNVTFSSVSDVKFIVYQKDLPTIKAFMGELSRQQSRGGATAGSWRRSTQYDDDDDDNSGNDTDDDLRVDPDHFDSSDTYLINITVKQGDITKESADCIVNSSNEELDLSRGAVAKSLQKIGGKELSTAIAKLKDEMKKNGIVVSVAPNMKCKHIIHVKAVNDLNEWRDVVVNCLKKAEERKCTSIAFPALGTGMSLKASDIAPIMIQAVRDFETKCGPSSLTDVRFVVYQDSMVNDFKKVLEKQRQKDGNGSTSKGASAWVNKSGPQPKPRPTVTNKVIFVIYSLDKKTIKDAIKKLEACINKEIHQQSFSDSIIKKMNDNQTAKVKQIASKYQLEVALERSSGNLVINGITSNVNSAANDIHKLLREVQAVESDKQSAELMSHVVQWFYIEITDVGQKLEPYEADLNYRIENAYKDKKKNIAFESDGVKFILDFSDMVEYPEGKKADESMSVIRRDLIKDGAKFEAPASWVDFSGNQKVVTLQSTDGDYKTLEAKFLQSAGSGFTVTKIERIMNKTLWSQYQAKKKQLDDQNPKGTQNERQLWHGTALDAVDNINAHGFNRSYCGKNATAYGDGVYFAVNANYSASHTYSRPDSTGVKRMYHCLVLTGEYTKGRSGMRVAPSKNSADDKTALYDSVVDNPVNPGMFIIFHDTQAYPEYLVSFKNK